MIRAIGLYISKLVGYKDESKHITICDCSERKSGETMAGLLSGSYPPNRVGCGKVK
jgi:hypothetical protein